MGILQTIGTGIKAFTNALSSAGKRAQNVGAGVESSAKAYGIYHNAQLIRKGETPTGGTGASSISPGVDWEAQAQAIANSEAEREYNSAEAQKNRDFQLMMSNTSYQRAVEDMRKAGINPILAAQNGGASTGSGAMASTSAAETMQATANYDSNLAMLNYLSQAMRAAMESGSSSAGKIAGTTEKVINELNGALRKTKNSLTGHTSKYSGSGHVDY